jgi:PAS domain-containing protein
MTHGLCMFDAEQCLLVWNRRYLEIFGLSEDAVHVGMSQRAIIEALVALGRYKRGATVDAISEGTRTSLTEVGAELGPCANSPTDGSSP